ncbi:MAG: hypothetical protein COT43_10225 [Candidatus Marinimicrobia bacterium CG08_land_8_20_14_0_20_45_22]|nr:MAG: hypothetical protein COT43_10225 [Candidatus Marinimicrobia bacterium CG08_land_8_20_14_0_20_45_22]
MSKYFSISTLLICILGGFVMQCNQAHNFIFQKFEAKIKTIENPLERQIAANELVQAVRKGKYPIFENDSTVVLLYQGNDSNIVIDGDMTLWTDFWEMETIPGIDLKFKRMVLEPDARLEYGLAVTKTGFPFPDPLNPYKVLNGFGPFSELAMPKYERHPIFEPFKYGKKSDLSQVTKIVHESQILGYSHDIFVYLPPNYNESQKYPVLYLQDGQDYIEFCHIPVMLDNLIQNGQIRPLMAVFIQPPNRFKGEIPNRMTEYGLNEKYVDFLCGELVPFIDKTYSTIKKPSARLVCGDSFGGLVSVFIGFRRPDIFGLAYGQSGYYSFQKDSLIHMIADAEKKNVCFRIDAGNYERRVGASFLPQDEGDFCEAARRLKAVLDEKGYEVIHREYHEGHTWGNWRRHLIDALEDYFGK